MERMPVQAGTFVPLGNLGQTVCRFEVELFINIHDGSEFTIKNKGFSAISFLWKISLQVFDSQGDFCKMRVLGFGGD
jgi:hypothetical protein